MDGRRLTLTCSTPSEGVTHYEFFRGSDSLQAKSSANILTLEFQMVPENLEYTCVAYRGEIVSASSAVYNVRCELLFKKVFTFLEL